jgi:RNA polymerase subunit RPABC4/transcription elongation factor Spt4
MDFETAYHNVRDLFTKVLEGYHEHACQCAYPRYRQLMAIDCVDWGKSFSCYETELLIELSKPYFNWSANNLNPDNTWICKTCGSTYSYEWQDFSISVNRQTVKIVELKTKELGKQAMKPIPLFLGLSGHSFPPATEIRQAFYPEFEDYLKES